MSFNFGPTLLSWLRRERRGPPGVPRRRRLGRAWHASGHGNAIAQAYNHMILPLATPRDRRTQIRWGLRELRAPLPSHARGPVVARDRRRALRPSTS
ncbi:MAG: hypothetical protein M0C28_11710 [Candidatus Moduliflexus flocculans]|nr:hypothetical protein [Candidatus Moduliflexus flocculans]